MSLAPQEGDLVPQRGLGHSGSGLQLAAGSSPLSRDTGNLELWATNWCQQLHSGRTKRCWGERGCWEVTGSLRCGGCMDWFHIGPTLPSSSPHRSCNRRHLPCKRCPKTRGKAEEGARGCRKEKQSHPDPLPQPPGARPLWRSRGWQDQHQLPSHTWERVELQKGKKPQTSKDQSTSCNPRQ